MECSLYIYLQSLSGFACRISLNCFPAKWSGHICQWWESKTPRECPSLKFEGMQPPVSPVLGRENRDVHDVNQKRPFLCKRKIIYQPQSIVASKGVTTHPYRLQVRKRFSSIGWKLNVLALASKHWILDWTLPGVVRVSTTTTCPSAISFQTNVISSQSDESWFSTGYAVF